MLVAIVDGWGTAAVVGGVGSLSRRSLNVFRGPKSLLSSFSRWGRWRTLFAELVVPASRRRCTASTDTVTVVTTVTFYGFCYNRVAVLW